MKIIQMLPELNFGGVERGVIELSRELVRHGNESIVLSAGGKLAQQINNDGGHHIVFDCAQKNPLTAPLRARRLRQLLSSLDPDIIHIRSRVPAWLLRLAGAPCPVVSTFHGLYTVGHYSAPMAATDKVICPSTAVFEHVRNHYATPEHKTAIIHRGVDLEHFNPQKADDNFCQQFRKTHRLGNAAIVTSIGRYSSLKGHDTFIRAIAYVKHEAPNTIGLLVGYDRKCSKQLERLKKTAIKLGVKENLRFIAAQKNIRDIYHLSNVIVSASIKPEAFGRTITESLAMERAVVATKHGGAMDIIEHGKNGYLVAPAEAAELAQAIIRATTKKWNGLRESASRFSLTQMTEKTIAVYEDIHALKLKSE